MPVTSLTRVARCAALFQLATVSVQAAWDVGIAGTEACLAAVEANDLVAAQATCRTGSDADLNAVDAFNLALLMHDVAPVQARSLLERAADAGLAEADHVLGNLRLDENAQADGIARLERAARAGLALAQYDLATALLERGNEGDPASAARWYGWAAAGGDEAARYNLGVLMLSGRLGASRPLWAWAWFSSIEALSGHDEVRRLARELGEQMNAEQRAQAHDHLTAIQADPAAAAAAAAS